MDTPVISILAIVNTAAMNTWIWGCRLFFKLVFSFFSDKYPEVELLSHIVVLFLIFWGNSILFSIVAVPVYIPISGPQTLVTSCPFDNNHSDRCEVISHHGFDLHFPDGWLCWTFFHVQVGYLLGWPKGSFGFFCTILRKKNLNKLFGQSSVCLLWKNVYSYPIPYLSDFFFAIELYEFFIQFGY